MPRYTRRTVVVEAKQVGTQTNLGSLGVALATSDWLITTASGTLVTTSAINFDNKYTTAPEGSETTGVYYD